MTSYSRPDVLRILQISSRQLQGWERAGIFPAQQTYTFQDLGQLRTLRSLRDEDVSAASIRHSIVAMRAVAGLDNPLLEASLVRTGTRLAFRCHGAIVDPIRRQLLFDFERFEHPQSGSQPSPLRNPRAGVAPGLQDLFIAAVQAEEAGEKHQAIALYHKMIVQDPAYAPAYINLGTLHFHLRQFTRAEELYRRATEIDPSYVLAFFDLGNVLDELDRPEESIAAYTQAVSLAPQYADAHYNLALAYERKGQFRPALRHWRAYIRLDKTGPWSEHARGQIRKLLEREPLSIAWRADKYVAQGKGAAQLQLVVSSPSALETIHP
ncbi:MAG TPA: tetratricopeptide repeat protein [Terracidiphilus sp.]|nr:tetratricopeptide repeat protein [Terracidiphilus sp.]